MTLNIKICFKILVAVVLSTAILSVGQTKVRADGGLCSVVVSPATTNPGADNLYSVVVTNSGSNPIIWVDINPPSTFLYSGQAISQDDWSSNEHGDGVTTTNGSIAAGANYGFSVSARSGVPNGNYLWQIYAAQSSDGSGKQACSGSTGVSVNGHLPNESNNGISNVALTDVTSSSATITWESDVDTTSIVYYGTTSDYGMASRYDSSHVSSHSMTINGLQPLTQYHFQVAGQDTAVNPYYSADGTFYTLARTLIQPIDVIAAAPSTNRPAIIIKPGGETVKPTVSIATVLPKVVKQIPKISGVAEDNVAVARVDYSTDGGRNWLPAETTGLGGKKVPFSFTPNLVKDANYQLAVRAIDTAGNIVQTPILQLVVDRLPPRFGNAVIAFGSQELSASQDGTIDLTSGVDYQITGQAFGGATQVTAVGNLAGKPATKAVKMTLGADTGLWSSTVRFEKVGDYELSVQVIDGADNRVDRTIGTMRVQSSGQVVDAQKRQVAGATVEVHFLEPSTKRWVVWDGAEYGQSNPQKITNKSYGFMVPAGEYYLSATAPGYGKVISKSLKTDNPQNISLDFELASRWSLKIGRVVLALPSWKVQPLPTQNQTKIDAKNQSAMTAVPHFVLPKVNGGSASYADLYGRPTDLVVLSTWMPSLNEQLDAIQSAQKNPDVGVLPVYIGGTPELVRAYLQSSGIVADGLADPDSSIGDELKAGFGPKHIFIDRSGHIKKVMVGVLSEEQILRTLGGN